MSSVALQRRTQKAPLDLPAAPLILPTLFGEGYGQYRTRGSTFVLSFLPHTLVVVLLLLAGRFVEEHRHEVRQQVIGIVTDVSPYILPPSASKAGGGGSGGDLDKLAASKGTLPRFGRVVTAGEPPNGPE